MTWLFSGAPSPLTACRRQRSPESDPECFFGRLSRSLARLAAGTGSSHRRYLQYLSSYLIHPSFTYSRVDVAVVVEVARGVSWLSERRI